MKFVFRVATLLISLAFSKVRELDPRIEPLDQFSRHEFVIVNYYDSSYESDFSSEIFDKAYKKFISVKQFSQDAQVGWYSSNMEDPLIKHAPGNKPCTVIMHSSQDWSYEIEFKPLKDGDKKSIDKRAADLAKVALKMTGDWVDHIDCSDIEGLKDRSTDQTLDFVFFGSMDSLEQENNDDSSKEETQMVAILRASIEERYKYPDRPAKSFYITTDSECA